MRLPWFCLLLLLLAVGTAPAQMGRSMPGGGGMSGGAGGHGGENEAPKEDSAELARRAKVEQRLALASYCRADFLGARLEAKTWSRIHPYTSLDVNPEFHRLVIVNRYEVVNPPEGSDNWTVNYHTVGYYLIGEGYTPATTPERADFQLEADKPSGKFLVASVRPEDPYVSPRAALTWMNARLIATTTGEAERKQLQLAIATLTKLVSPNATAAATANK